MKKSMLKVCIGLLAPMMTLSASAQTALPSIVIPHKQTINYQERTLSIDVVANVEYTITEDASWIDIMKTNDGKIYIHAKENPTTENREAQIIFANEEAGLSETFVVLQKQNQAVETLPTDVSIKPSGGSDNSHQSSDSNWQMTIDGDMSTMWHTAWSGFNVSESNPAIIEYTFRNVERIDYINYYPRNGGGNGSFGLVDLYIQKVGETDYTLYGSYNWLMGSSVQSIEFPNGLENPKAIKFVVKSGAGNFASCAEMQFMRKNPDLENMFSVFADDVYSELKEGVSQEEILNIENDFARILAQQIFDGTYEKNYRVASYKPYLHYDVLSQQWCTAGKRYSQREGVTGINISKGKHAIIVSGIPSGETVQLNITAWYVGKIGNNFDGGNPETTTYALKNGINIIEYTHDWDGLAYVGYYTQNDPKTLPNIKVHFVNGQINGYLSPEKSNEEMFEICDKAKNYCMDIVGNRVQHIWTSKGLRDYCKATDGKSLGYRQFIAAIDSLIQWEHDELGLVKYGRQPENHSMTYVNFTYYMFQGGFGVSFHCDQESRVLNCKNIMYNDDDAIWGLSHEWGHQHQMHPYLCWSGTGEVTNNIFSYFNIMHMGYNRSDKINDWPVARDIFYNDNATKDGKQVSTSRHLAYENAKNDASLFSYSPKMRDMCLAMKDSTVTSYQSDPLRAIGLHDLVENQKAGTSIRVGYILHSFIMLGNYAKLHLQKPGVAQGVKYLDFYPDLFESLRRMQQENGSDIEKSGAWDKYELIFHAQYGTLDGGYELLKKHFPNSSWITDKYVTQLSHMYGYTENIVPAMLNFIRKASRLYGYNLFPYFERHGYLRTIALHVNDYSWGYYVMTKEMYNEFKADMQALVDDGTLKAMPEGMVKNMMYTTDLNDKANNITRYPTPNIPN